MTLGELLASIGQRLAAAGIPYMVTGSVASSFHGEPRATRDLDLVIDPSPEALDRFVGALPAETFYVDRGAAKAALAERSQFNVIDQASGWKVDLMIRKAGRPRWSSSDHNGEAEPQMAGSFPKRARGDSHGEETAPSSPL